MILDLPPADLILSFAEHKSVIELLPEIAARARDCGMEITYDGIRLTPAEIVAAAVEKQPDVIGLSILSGSHLPLIRETLDLLREAGLSRTLVYLVERGEPTTIETYARRGEVMAVAAEEARARGREIAEQTRKFIVGAVCALPLFLLSMGRDFGLTGDWSHAAWVNGLFWALATPVQFYTGWDYYTGGFKSLRNRSANMDVLVAMGSSVAYGYSVALLLYPALGHHVYFETSAVIITLIKLGKMLESRTKSRTGGAIRKKKAAECEAHPSQRPYSRFHVIRGRKLLPQRFTPSDFRITSRTFQAWVPQGQRFAVFTNLYYDSAGADMSHPWA